MVAKPMIFKRQSKIRPVKIDDMRVHEQCQRQERPGWTRYLNQHWDFNEFGYPVVNWRDGVYWLIDGQHRVAVLKAAELGDQAVDCVVYENLSDEDMAEMFLRLNDRKTVGLFDKFIVGVQADRADECAVVRMVESNGLKVARNPRQNTVAAVGALMKIRNTFGDTVLGQTLRALKHAYDGAPEAFDGFLMTGVGMVFNRFNGRTNEAHMADALATVKKGPTGIRQRAELIQEKVGADKRHCIAAAVVEAYNKNAPKNGKLDSWWKANE